MEFFSERYVKAKKPHRCDACQTQIEKGIAHSYMAFKVDGIFWTARNHLECRAAECGLAELHGLFGGEDWIFLHDLEPEDAEWLEINHPAAFTRIAHRYAEEDQPNG